MSDPSDPDATSAYHPAPPSAAPRSDRRTVALEPDKAVPGPRGATVAGGDLDRPVPDIGTPAAAAASFGPADPTSVTMAADARATVAGSEGPEAGPSDLGSALASKPSFGPPPDPHAVTGASDAPREGIRRTAPAIPG